MILSGLLLFIQGTKLINFLIYKVEKNYLPLFTLSKIVEEKNCLPPSTLHPGLIAKDCLRTVKSRLALRSRLFFCSIVYHHAENGLIHRKTVVDRPIVTTSVGDTLFQTRPGMMKNWPSQSFAKLHWVFFLRHLVMEKMRPRSSDSSSTDSSLLTRSSAPTRFY